MKRAVIYCRVSTEEQTLNYSLSAQEDMCREFARERHLHVVETFREDHSGAVVERPVMLKIIQMAYNKEFDILLVSDLDRYARGLKVQIQLDAIFEQNDVEIESVLHEYEHTPEGMLQRNIKAAFAEFERLKYRERSMRGKRNRAKAGYIITGRVKYGYRYVSEPHRGWYEINEEEARTVRLIYTLFTVGDETGRKMGCPKIAKYLSERRIPTRQDGMERNTKKIPYGTWDPSVVYDILRDETYTGRDFYGKTKTVQRGNKSYRRPNDDTNQLIPLPTPAIIDHATWEAAQRQFELNRTFSPRNAKYPYLLRGMITCSVCGYTLIGTPNSDGRTKRYYYRCRGLKDKTCKGYIRVDYLDELVWKKIREYIEQPDLILQVMRERQEETRQGKGLLLDRIKALQDEVSNLSAKSERLLDLYIDSTFSKEQLDGKSKALTEEKKKLLEEIDLLSGQLQAEYLSDEQVLNIYSFCQQIRNGLDLFDASERRWVMELLEIRAVLHREKSALEISGLFPSINVLFGEETCPHNRSNAQRFSFLCWI